MRVWTGVMVWKCSRGICLGLLVGKMEDRHLASAVLRPQTQPRIHQGS